MITQRQQALRNSMRAQLDRVLFMDPISFEGSGRMTLHAIWRIRMNNVADLPHQPTFRRPTVEVDGLLYRGGREVTTGTQLPPLDPLTKRVFHCGEIQGLADRMHDEKIRLEQAHGALVPLICRATKKRTEGPV